jgi:hypothetical protein
MRKNGILVHIRWQTRAHRAVFLGPDVAMVLFLLCPEASVLFSALLHSCSTGSSLFQLAAGLHHGFFWHARFSRLGFCTGLTQHDLPHAESKDSLKLTNV